MSLFPQQLSIAKICPVYKKGDKLNPKNYRPISVLPTIAKIFEKIVKDKLVAHITHNKIMNERQFGYQKGVGTGKAVEKLIDDVVKKLNDRQKVLFLDLSSAFHTVNHELLLKKLELYGIRGKLQLFFRSYLENRFHFVD